VVLAVFDTIVPVARPAFTLTVIVKVTALPAGSGAWGLVHVMTVPVLPTAGFVHPAWLPAGKVSRRNVVFGGTVSLRVTSPLLPVDHGMSLGPFFVATIV